MAEDGNNICIPFLKRNVSNLSSLFRIQSAYVIAEQFWCGKKNIQMRCNEVVSINTWVHNANFFFLFFQVTESHIMPT